MSKLMTNRGETLVETLISIIIVVISVAFLVTSVTVASKINAKVKDKVSDTLSFKYSESVPTDGTVTATDVIDSGGIKVKIYESNGYYYYVKE